MARISELGLVALQSTSSYSRIRGLVKFKKALIEQIM